MIFNMLYTVFSTLILKPIFLYMKKELFISVCWKILMGNSSGCSLPKLWHFHYGRVFFIYIYMKKREKKAQNNFKIFYLKDKSKSDIVFNCNRGK